MTEKEIHEMGKNAVFDPLTDTYYPEGEVPLPEKKQPLVFSKPIPAVIAEQVVEIKTNKKVKNDNPL